MRKGSIGIQDFFDIIKNEKQLIIVAFFKIIYFVLIIFSLKN